MSKSIGALEEIILLLVIVLEENAYAVTISEEYEKISTTLTLVLQPS